MDVVVYGKFQNELFIDLSSSILSVLIHLKDNGFRGWAEGCSFWNDVPHSRKNIPPRGAFLNGDAGILLDCHIYLDAPQSGVLCSTCGG